MDRQLIGRAGRQGNSGSSHFFASLEDGILTYLKGEDKKMLMKKANEIASDDITTEEIASYFRKAQQACEIKNFKTRQNLNKKDDIIAPHRYKFLTIRNKILFNHLSVDTVLFETFKKVPLDILYQKTLDLYNRFLPIAKKIRQGQKLSNKMLIPFSLNNKETFAIEIDINKYFDDIKYFDTEYKKQITLQTLDKYWKQFVLHLSDDLDIQEINSLENDFNNMKTEIEAEILDKIIKAKIPVGGVADNTNIETETQISKSQTSKSNNNNILNLNTLCPCGSGKKYGECHGKDIHHKAFRKRRR